MNVKLKSIVISSLSIIFAVIVTSFVLNIGMNKYIDNIEHIEIDEDFKILNSIIAKEYENLQRTALDWAHWDDTYYFISGKNQQNYIEANLQDDTLKQLNINFMYFYDNKGNLINSITKNIASNEKQLLNLKLSNYSNFKFNGGNTCILNCDGKLYILSEADITTTDEKANSNGKFIIGKRLDKNMLDYINSITKDDIKINSADKWKLLNNDVYKIENNNIVSIRKIQDVSGNKDIAYSIAMYRNEYSLGKLYFRAYIVTFSIILILTAVAAIYLFDKYVLKRLKIVNGFLNKVAETQNFGITLNLNCNDEIGSISNTVNKMLAEIEGSHKKLIELSYTDKMTELKNRTYIDKCFERLDSDSNSRYTIIMGDVNGLKLTNDTYGHSAGDKLIITMANIIKEACAEDDIICRWGGDEFLILIENKPESYCEKLINEIKEKCKNVSDFGFNVSIAIGSADNKTVSGTELVLNLAEQKMYRCKLIDVHSSRNSTIKSLKKTLYEKHSETEEHTIRVKNLGLALGKKINLPQDKLEELELLCTLHDIGKIGIPEQILMKPGKLTNEEWEVMKSHTEIGYRIAKATPELAYVADEILSHHEKYDGTGYPRGLKGQGIPILSRIINIVDSFDVMTHKREYKETKSFDYAVDELKRCSGTQFDPMLVEKFLMIITNKEEG